MYIVCDVKEAIVPAVIGDCHLLNFMGGLWGKCM